MSVVVRYDHNVPVDATGEVSDWSRIDRSVPELRRLVAAGEAVTVLSHWGYPGGRVVPERSTAPLADRLRTHGIPVRHVAWPGSAARPGRPGPGQVLYLENVRFDAGEEADDEGFAAALAAYGDRYLLGALSVAHRRHASVATLPRLLPVAGAGEEVRRQLDALATLEAAGPIGLIVGGAKVLSKLMAAEKLVAGAAFLALAGRCGEVAEAAASGGAGSAEELAVARRVLEAARTAGTPILGGPDVSTVVRRVEQAVDGGVRALLWCGPLGVYERAGHLAETARLAGLMQRVAAGGGQALAAGGDTVASLRAVSPGADPGVEWITAGGSALAYLARGWGLPGLAPLKAVAVGARAGW